MKRLIAFCELLRLPTVFTALADILLGFLLTHRGMKNLDDLSHLLIASASLYLSGMVFNDYFDRDVDAVERASRPIPSGRIGVREALILGLTLLAIGNLAAAFAGRDSFRIAAMLTVAVVAYDGFLKRTFLGPVAMGSCRFLNVMLGASAIGNWNSVWTALQVPVAAGLGLYVCGLTWFARREAVASQRGQLVGAALVINGGLALLACTIVFFSNRSALDEPLRVLFALGVIAVVVNRRLVAAIFDAQPVSVQRAVKSMLLSLVMLDAVMIFFKTGNSVFAVATVALLIPAMVLSRWIRMT